MNKIILLLLSVVAFAVHCTLAASLREDALARSMVDRAIADGRVLSREEEDRFLSSLFNSLWNPLDAMLSQIPIFGGIASTLGNTVGNMVKIPEQLLGGLTGGLTSGLTGGGATAATASGRRDDLRVDFVNRALEDQARKAGRKLSREEEEKLDRFFSNLWNAFTAPINNIAGNIPLLGDVVKAGTGVVGDVLKVPESILGSVAGRTSSSDVMTKEEQDRFFSNLWQAFTQPINNIAGNIPLLGDVVKAGTGVVGDVLKVPESILNSVTGGRSGLSRVDEEDRFFSSIYDSLWNPLNSILSQIPFLGSILSTAGNTLGQVVKMPEQVLNSVTGGLTGGLTGSTGTAAAASG